MKYQVNNKGYYGEFGGAWIPEMMYTNIEELNRRYLEIIESVEFKKEFDQLLKDYVGRPSPLYFAGRLSEHYGTKIYLKREDLNHTGSHKLNNTIGQILLAEQLGKTRIIAETGAGQHGVATATVCALKGIKCVVYMGALDVSRQAPNVKKMKMLGAEVVPVHSGNKTLKDATNEAMRDWINNPEDTHYIIGSVVGPHPYPDMVARFQSVISAEMKGQLKTQTGSELPTRVLACFGGGRVLQASKTMLLQNADGQITEPYSISAGLDYPGIGPLHAHLHKTGRAKFLAATDEEVLKAVLLLTQKEGIIPALESAHALAALDKIKMAPGDVNVVNLSGSGNKDMETYLNYFGY